MSPISIFNQNSSLKSFLQKLAWVMAGEGVIRITRLIAAIFLARYLSPSAFGMVAVVLTCDEIARVLTRNGIGQKIIHCRESELLGVCRKAYQLNWWVHSFIFVTLMVVSKPIANAFNQPDLQFMIMILALTYLIYPWSMVQVCLLQRKQKMKQISLYTAYQVGLDNLLTAVLVVEGVGVWSVIIPKLIVAPIWVYLYRKASSWRYSHFTQASVYQWSEFREYSLPIFAVELLKTLRQYLDRLFVAAIFGLDVLGLYYFAINAGSGLSLALIKAYITVVFPDMCTKIRAVNKLVNSTNKLWSGFYYQANKRYLQFVVPIIALQFILAPYYVPIVFGQQWIPAITILMVLCTASVFQGFSEISSQALRSFDETKHDFKFNQISTIFYFVFIISSAFLGFQTGKALLSLSLSILAHSLIFAFLHAKFVKQTLSEKYMACSMKHSNTLLSVRALNQSSSSHEIPIGGSTYVK